MNRQNLPALTNREAERLRDIAGLALSPDPVDLSPNAQRTSTDELIRCGYVIVKGRKVAASGRVMKAGECEVTPLGLDFLKRTSALLPKSGPLGPGILHVSPIR